MAEQGGGRTGVILQHARMAEWRKFCALPAESATWRPLSVLLPPHAALQTGPPAALSIELMMSARVGLYCVSEAHCGRQQAHKLSFHTRLHYNHHSTTHSPHYQHHHPSYSPHLLVVPWLHPFLPLLLPEHDPNAETCTSAAGSSGSSGSSSIQIYIKAWHCSCVCAN